MDLEQFDYIFEYIKEHKIQYISFDLYDTLVFRALNLSEDVWKLLHRRYIKEYGSKKVDIRKLRKKGEEKARQKSQTEDVTFDNIYNEIDLEQDERERIKKIELEIEIEVSIANANIIGLLKKLKEEGAFIIITTDMYLPKRTIETILSNHGIPYERLYISGYIGMRKDSGKLFEYVLSDLCIAPNQIIHIGDNPQADVEKPKSLGIQSFLYECKDSTIVRYFEETECGFIFYKNNFINRIRKKLRRKYDEIRKNKYADINTNYYLSYLNSVCKSNSSDDIRLGYCILGPMVVAFCKWIHDVADKKKLDQIWFVAREGYLIKKIYLTLYPEEENRVKYVRYNKNLLRLPFALFANDSEDKRALLPSVSTLSINDLLTLFSVDYWDKVKISKKIEEKTGLRIDSVIHTKYLDDSVAKVVWNIIIEAISSKAEEQNELLIRSLQETAHSDGKSILIGLVNNSINGSGQYMLEKIIENADDLAVKLYGLQIIDSDSCHKKNILYSAWLEDVGIPFYFNFFHRTLNVFERLLFENCGTALSFVDKEGKVIIECEERKEEKKNDIILISIQNKAVEFSKNAKRFEDFDITENALSIYFYMMCYPYLVDAQIIGSLMYDEVNDSGYLISVCKEKGRLRILNKARSEMWSNGFLAVNNAPKIFQDLFVWKSKFF